MITIFVLSSFHPFRFLIMNIYQIFIYLLYIAKFSIIFATYQQHFLTIYGQNFHSFHPSKTIIFIKILIKIVSSNDSSIYQSYLFYNILQFIFGISIFIFFQKEKKRPFNTEKRKISKISTCK